MGRPAINPAKKKRTVSVTLTPKQCQLLQWAAAETGDNTSVFLGRLIEREAKKIAKQKNKPLPNMDGQQLQWTADGQIQAQQTVRRLCQTAAESKPSKPRNVTE